MPHDAHGQQLQVGDPVLIRGRVISLCTGELYCNCTVRLDHQMPGNSSPTEFSALNCRQLQRVNPPSNSPETA